MLNNNLYRRTRRRAVRALCFLFIIHHSAFIISCTPVTKPPPKQSPAIDENGSLITVGRPAEKTHVERVLNADPCGNQIHDISGAMLEYLVLHGQLPQKLSELQTLPDLDQPLKFACPVSGQPYVYAPDGLRSPDDARLIVLYDALPGPGGLRWVMLMRPATPRQVPAMWVDQMPEQVFHRFSEVPGQ